MFRKLFNFVAVLILIAAVTATVVAYGRGYRFNADRNSVVTTGILAASSSPDGASVWIDGKLATATNASVTLSPGWYHVRIIKEGYQAWEKDIRIQGEIVSKVDVLLPPANPSFRALTFTGVLSPKLSPSGEKVAYIVPEDQSTFSATLRTKTGVWILDLKNGPLGGASSPRQIYSSLARFDWTATGLTWSPDEKQILLTFKTGQGTGEKIIQALELASDIDNPQPPDITLTYQDILNDWTDQTNQKKDTQIATLPLSIGRLLTYSVSFSKLSPDETKILYEATAAASLAPVITPPLIGTNSTKETRTLSPSNIYVYDLKEDKNFQIGTLPGPDSPNPYTWYTDSKHIVMIDNGAIYITDYDGTNKRTLYVGPFQDNLVFPWASGGKLVILTNFNKPQSLPNLYEIDLQ